MAAICFSPSLHFFLRPQTLQTFFRTSLSSTFHHFPSARKGWGERATLWHLNGNSGKGLVGKLSTLKDLTCSACSYSRGNSPQPGKRALQDPAPGPAHPPPVTVSEVPSRARHCLTLVVGSPDISFLPNQTDRLMKARSLYLQVPFT